MRLYVLSITATVEHGTRNIVLSKVMVVDGLEEAERIARAWLQEVFPVGSGAQNHALSYVDITDSARSFVSNQNP